MSHSLLSMSSKVSQFLGDIFWDSSHLHVKSLAATQEDHSNKHRLLALIEDLQEK